MHQLIQPYPIYPLPLLASSIFSTFSMTLRMRNSPNQRVSFCLMSSTMRYSQMQSSSSAQVTLVEASRQKITIFLRYRWGLRSPLIFLRIRSRYRFFSSGISHFRDASLQEQYCYSFHSSYSQPLMLMKSVQAQTAFKTIPQTASMLISRPSLSSVSPLSSRYIQTKQVQASVKSLISSSIRSLFLCLLSLNQYASSFSPQSSFWVAVKLELQVGNERRLLPWRLMFFLSISSVSRKMKCLKGADRKDTLNIILCRAFPNCRQKLTKSPISCLTCSVCRLRKTVSGITRLEFWILAYRTRFLSSASSVFICLSLGLCLRGLMKRGRKSLSLGSGFSQCDWSYCSGWNSLLMMVALMALMLNAQWLPVASCRSQSSEKSPSQMMLVGRRFSSWAAPTSQKKSLKEFLKGTASCWFYPISLNSFWKSRVSNLQLERIILQKSSLLRAHISSNYPAKCFLNCQQISSPQMYFPLSLKDSSSCSRTSSKLEILPLPELIEADNPLLTETWRWEFLTMFTDSSIIPYMYQISFLFLARICAFTRSRASASISYFDFVSPITSSLLFIDENISSQSALL